jgi:hypothetical protein
MPHPRWLFFFRVGIGGIGLHVDRRHLFRFDNFLKIVKSPRENTGKNKSYADLSLEDDEAIEGNVVEYVTCIE